jgi:probable O-glycosylation ligase (exosortase A-associated)
MRDLVAALIVPILVYYSLKRPFIGLGIWLWSSTYHISMFTFGFASAIPFNKVFALATIISFVINRDKPGFRLNSISAMIFLFFIISTISNNFPLNNPEASNAAWEDYAKIVVFYFIAIGVLDKEVHYNFLIWLMVVAIGGLASAEGAKLLLSGGSYRTASIAGVVGDNNFFGVMAGTALPFINYLRVQSTNKTVQSGLLAALILSCLGIFATYSRGALLGILIFAFFLIQKAENKPLWIVVVTLVTVAFMSFLPDTWFNRMDTMNAAEKDTSFMGRVLAWKISALVAMDNVFGGGFRAIETPVTWFVYGPGLYKLDFLIATDNDLPPGFILASHSVYFQILGNQGFIGLFLFLLILVTSYFKAGHIHKVAKANGQHWAMDLTKMIQVAILIYAVTGALVAIAYFDFIYAIFAIVTTLESSVKPKYYPRY